jgi:hypothetical protein
VQPADRDAAARAFDALYRGSGWRPPRRVVWFDSPAAAARAVVETREPALFTPGADHGSADAVRNAYSRAAWVRLERHFSRRSRDRIKRILDHPLRTATAGRSTPAFDRPGCGQHDAMWIGAFDAGRRMYGIEQPRALDGWAALARSCGWWWAFRDTAFACERQTRLRLDERDRLHAADGPALRFRDGFDVYAIHGVRIDPWIVEEPERITPVTIAVENNSEVRRVLMDIYGIERYLNDVGAVPFAQDEFGTLYHLGDRRAQIVLVKVRNSTPEPDGTWKDYYLRVPPDVRTPREAVAWTFGLDAAEYAPRTET